MGESQMGNNHSQQQMIVFFVAVGQIFVGNEDVRIKDLHRDMSILMWNMT
jgi:hypothetical protein